MQVDHSQNIIEVKNLSFGYTAEPVLKDVSFNIHRGDYLGIIGPNGGGKTTLLKSILGLLTPTKGSVVLYGTPLEKFKDWAKIGYVSQNCAQAGQSFPATVTDVVMMGRVAKKGLFRLLDIEDRRTVDWALEQVDMAPYKDRLISELSGGQCQRVCIARALASRPEVLVLDEPTAGVDLKAQEDFYNLLKKLNNDLELTLILVSHDIDVVANEATEILCVNQTVVYHGEPKDFIKEDYLTRLYGKGVKQILHEH